MKEPLLYFIESIVCSGLFFALYHLLIMHHTSYKVSRYVMIIGIFMSCLIPLLQIPVWQGDVVVMPAENVIISNDNSYIQDIESYNWRNWTNIMWTVYILGVGLVLGGMVIRLSRTYRLRQIAEKIKFEKYSIAVHEMIKTPYSFLHTIYLPIIEDESERKQIIAHEKSHIKHEHSQERILLELLKAFCWFNPFVWLSMKKLIEIQEMEADADVLNQGYDVTEYRTTLLKQVLGIKGDLTCNLVGHPLKKRFFAMTMVRTEKNARAILLLPFLMVAVIVFAFVKKPDEIKYLSGTVEEIKMSESKEVCTIMGKITDKETGEPIIGAVIKDKKTSKGAVTDVEGKYQLNLPKGSILEIVYPGYVKGAIIAGRDDTQTIDIALQTEGKMQIKDVAVKNKHSEEKRQIILVNDELYDKPLKDIPTNKIKGITIIKNKTALKPYIEKYGEIANNGIIKVELKE